MSSEVAPAEAETHPALCVTRKQFDTARRSQSLLAVTQAEAEFLGKTVAGSEIRLVEVREGFPTGRWLVTTVEQCYPNFDGGGYQFALAHPPSSFTDVPGHQAVTD